MQPNQQQNKPKVNFAYGNPPQQNIQQIVMPPMQQQMSQMNQIPQQQIY